jgi:hypothetical protein
MNKVFFHETYPPAKQLCCAFLQHFKALSLLSFSSTTSKTLSLLSFLHNSSLQEDSCTHTPCGNSSNTLQVFEPLRLCALPATAVLQQLPQVVTLRLHSAYALLAQLLCLTCTSTRMRTMLSLLSFQRLIL